MILAQADGTNLVYLHAAYVLIWVLVLAYLVRLHWLAREIERRRREEGPDD